MLNSVKAGVSRFYYVHGLFCTKYSILVLFLSLTITFLFVFPLRNVSLWEFPPHEYETAYSGYEPPSNSAKRVVSDGSGNRPRWYHSPPVAYVQQIFLRTSVNAANSCASHSNAECMVLSALYNSFELLDTLSAFRKANVDFELACLRLNSTRSSSASRSGEYVKSESDCLTVSPLSLWNADRARFVADARLADSRSETRASRRFLSDSTFRDALFGLRFEETGIADLLARANETSTLEKDDVTISFAVTLLLRRFDQRLLQSLRSSVRGAFGDAAQESLEEESRVAHLFFAHAEYMLFVPIGASYVLVFFYTVFAVRNVDLLRSRVGLAVSACATLILTTLITLGVCAHVNALPRLSGGEVFPYLVVVLGFDNLTNVTRAVVGTPRDLDVRFRVALGLAKLAWLNIRNRITLVVVALTGCLLQLDSVASGLRDFSRLALVAALADYFLQMFFFIPILALDLRRMELFDLHRHSTQKPNEVQRRATEPQQTTTPQNSGNSLISFVPCVALVRSACNSVLHSFTGSNNSASHRPISAFARRLCCVLISLVLITFLWLVIASLNLQHEADVSNSDMPHNQQQKPETNTLAAPQAQMDFNLHDAIALQDSWRRLSGNHWPVLFELFAMDLAGSYVSILPPITVETVLTSGVVQRFRDAVQTAARLGRLTADAFSLTSNETSAGWLSAVEVPRAHVFELVGFGGLIALLVALLAYICLVSAYSCCRLSISQDIATIDNALQSQRAETLQSRLLMLKPLALGSHRAEVQYVATSQRFAATVCLLGELRLWAATTGQLLHTLRLNVPASQPCQSQQSPTSTGLHRRRSGKFPDLSGAIHTEFQRTGANTSFETFLKSTVAPLYERHGDRERTCVSDSDSDCEDCTRSVWSIAFCEHADVGDCDAVQTELARCELKASLLFVGFSDGSVDVCDALSGRRLLCNWRVLESSSKATGVVFLAASCKREKLAIARLDGALELLDFRFTNTASELHSLTLQPVHTLQKHLEAVTALQLCGDYLVSGSFDRTVKLFDLLNGSLLCTLYGHLQPITAVRCRLAPLSSFGSKRSSRSSLAPAQTDTDCDNRDPLVCISGAKDGKVRINYTLSDNTAAGWQSQIELSGLRHAVMGVELTPDTQLVTAVDAERNLCIWRRSNAQLLHSVGPSTLRPAAFCFDLLVVHRFLLVPTANGLDVLEMASGERVDSCLLADADENAMRSRAEPCGILTHALPVGQSDANAVVCTCGKRVLLVRFPLITLSARV